MAGGGGSGGVLGRVDWVQEGWVGDSARGEVQERTSKFDNFWSIL